MDNNKKYNIENFFIGELYLYSNFANFTSRLYNEDNQDSINIFSETEAINFQKEPLSRYINWDAGREYTGFLTIFYKQGNNYICLHNGKSYRLKSDTFIENLIPLNNLLPKVNSKLEPNISIDKALELFNILFKSTEEESSLYNDNKHNTQDYYIGDLLLEEIIITSNGYKYLNLPYHTILNKLNLSINSYETEQQINKTYRCLFLKQDNNLYNINNYQFYNPNENNLEIITSFKEYLLESNIKISCDSISIPKSLKLFKRTI